MAQDKLFSQRCTRWCREQKGTLLFPLFPPPKSLLCLHSWSRLHANIFWMEVCAPALRPRSFISFIRQLYSQITPYITRSLSSSKALPPVPQQPSGTTNQTWALWLRTCRRSPLLSAAAMFSMPHYNRANASRSLCWAGPGPAHVSGAQQWGCSAPSQNNPTQQSHWLGNKSWHLQSLLWEQIEEECKAARYSTVKMWTVPLGF